MRSGVVVAAVVLLASVAHAEDPATAERYFRMGEKAYQAQNFEAAAANFEEAFERYALPEIAFSAAQAYRRQYRIDPRPEYVQRAVMHYRTYLGKVKSGGRVADAADALSEMQHELDKLIASGVTIDPELAKEHTRVVINPSLDKEPGAAAMQEIDDTKRASAIAITAHLDGTPVEPFAPINVAPGVHRVRVAAAGYFPAEKQISVPQGTTTIADLALEPKPAHVTVSTEAGARVSLDGRPVGTSPLAAFDVPAGHHVVTISRRGRVAVARELMVTRGQDVRLDQPLEMTGRRRVVPWLLAGAAVAAGVTTTMAVIAVRNDNRAYRLLHEDIREFGDADRATLEDYRQATRWRDRGVFGVWVSGAALVGLSGAAALLYYTDNPSPDGVRVQPLATPGGAGAAIAGRF